APLTFIACLGDCLEYHFPRSRRKCLGIDVESARSRELQEMIDISLPQRHSVLDKDRQVFYTVALGQRARGGLASRSLVVFWIDYEATMRAFPFTFSPEIGFIPKREVDDTALSG